MSDGGKRGKVARPSPSRAVNGKERARDRLGAFAGASGGTVEIEAIRRAMEPAEKVAA